jgi:hypothetical protein
MLTNATIEALDKIKESINAEYGFKNNFPRVNLGPCGPFAKTFFDIWNDLFPEKVTICFLFVRESKQCEHIFIRLPDGNYFDGGFGVVQPLEAAKFIPGGYIEEMIEFNESELDKNAYGLNRKYAECPNYDHEKTRSIILSYLSPL